MRKKLHLKKAIYYAAKEKVIVKKLVKIFVLIKVMKEKHGSGFPMKMYVE